MGMRYSSTVRIAALSAVGPRVRRGIKQTCPSACAKQCEAENPEPSIGPCCPSLPSSSHTRISASSATELTVQGAALRARNSLALIDFRCPMA